ncbi:hypothetical protein FB451DRAFT_1556918 [Mycena latifolia]|nr:hypothetical protein FB451DRAFT_1556918 [Mycena latifolia]
MLRVISSFLHARWPPARSPLLRAAPISPAISLAPFSLRHDAIIIDDGARSDVLNDLSTFAAANIALLRRSPDRRRSPSRIYPTYVTFAAPSEAIALLHFLRRRIGGSRAVAVIDTINVVAHADAPNILLSPRRRHSSRLASPVRLPLNRHVHMPLRTPTLCPLHSESRSSAAPSALSYRPAAPSGCLVPLHRRFSRARARLQFTRRSANLYAVLAFARRVVSSLTPLLPSSSYQAAAPTSTSLGY